MAVMIGECKDGATRKEHCSNSKMVGELIELPEMS
jgi:hypothetical protein